MKVSVSEACEFIGTLFNFKITHRIGNCDKWLLTLLCVSVCLSVRTKAPDALRSAGFS